MKIGEIIQETQPEVYKVLTSKINKNKKRKQKKLNLNEKDIKDLMSHSSYRRGTGGAIRQVK